MKERNQKEALTQNLAFEDHDILREPYEDEYLSRFGSHFSVQFHPNLRSGGVLPVGLGPNSARAPVYFGWDLELPQGIERWSLPMHYTAVFNKKERTVQRFSIQRTMNTLQWTHLDEDNGIKVDYEWVSPFYPQDPKISTAPFFYVTSKLHNESRSPVKGNLYAGLEALKETRALHDGTIVQKVEMAAAFRGPELKPGKLLSYDLAVATLSDQPSFSAKLDSGSGYWQTHRSPFNLNPGQTIEITYIFASYLNNPSIVRRHGEDCDFFYKAYFANLEEVVAYARHERELILEKSHAFDALFANSTIEQKVKDFIAWNFHIYLGATWYLRDPSGTPFYTCYEGGTGYFSTIDVEYNLAPFYAMFWPSLLSDQLDLWATTYLKGNQERPFTFGPEHKIMPHDVGGGFEIDEQIYILGPMPVEENSNYLLLHHLFYEATGDLSFFIRHLDVCRQLADGIVASDLNGNGLPNVGTNNTLDCFEDLYKDVEDQVFLGIKAGSALLVFAQLLERAEKPELAAPYRAHAHTTFSTIESHAWLGDHYALTISPSKPKGWDLPSPLTTNGMAYLFLTGQKIPLRIDHLIKDMALSMKDYSMWPSMGVWRDMIGGYLSLEGTGDYRFRPDFRGDMYPRSFNSVWMIQAHGGLSFSAPDKTVQLMGKKDGAYPILQLADWEKGMIPWIHIKGGKLEKIDHEEVLNKFTVSILDEPGGS